MSKIAVGDDNAEDLDYRQIIGIATPSPQTIPIQTIALCLGVERVRGGGGATWVGEERDTAPIVRVFCFLDQVPRSGGGLWRDTIRD